MLTHISEVRAVGATVCFLALVSLAASIPSAEGGSPDEKQTSVAKTEAASGVPGVAIRELVKGKKMDINTASSRELELLPGIGPALASRIVSFREEHGAFVGVDDLARVRGIGPKTLERVRSMLKTAVHAE
jgi:competence protein ComEA